jgi:uncharacterized protein
VPTILIMPVTMILSYVIMRLIGVPLPEPNIPSLAIPLFFLVFFIGALGEKGGWSGYAIDPLQDRWGALPASLMVGEYGPFGTPCPIFRPITAQHGSSGKVLGQLGSG